MKNVNILAVSRWIFSLREKGNSRKHTSCMYGFNLSSDKLILERQVFPDCDRTVDIA